MRILRGHLGTARAAFSHEWAKVEGEDWYTLSIYDLDDGPDSMPITEGSGTTPEEAIGDACHGMFPWLMQMLNQQGEPPF